MRLMTSDNHPGWHDDWDLDDMEEAMAQLSTARLPAEDGEVLDDPLGMNDACEDGPLTESWG